MIRDRVIFSKNFSLHFDAKICCKRLIHAASKRDWRGSSCETCPKPHCYGIDNLQSIRDLIAQDQKLGGRVCNIQSEIDYCAQRHELVLICMGRISTVVSNAVLDTF